MSSLERWVVVPEYPRYLVSDFGNVVNQESGHILKPGDNGTGYLYVFLYGPDDSHRFYVHRLVAELFLNEDLEGFEINHIDGNKINNCFWNLEVVTRHQNIQHAFDIGLNHATRRKNVRPVQIIETGEIFESGAACARAIGGRQSTVQKVLTGTLKQHKGYSFRYVDN